MNLGSNVVGVGVVVGVVDESMVVAAAAAAAAASWWWAWGSLRLAKYSSYPSSGWERVFSNRTGIFGGGILLSLIKRFVREACKPLGRTVLAENQHLLDRPLRVDLFEAVGNDQPTDSKMRP